MQEQIDTRSSVSVPEGGALVVPLDAAGASGPSLLGGKGHGLARLSASGVAVPRGFVVTTAAFRAFMRHNGIDGQDDAATRIAAGSWPETLRSAVDNGLRAFGSHPVAVRSSATDEDSEGASFAGQHETLLGVSGAAAVFDAIAACWASLFRPEALRYRAEHAAEGARDLGMAVVVQAMVAAEASGVAFTVHPVQRDASVVVIDMCAGLGDALVSGRTTPDQCVLSKSDLSIVHRELAGAHPVLDDARVREVAALALGIERQLGAPQDIEWALGEGRVWALQARPITTTSEAATTPCDLDTPTGRGTTWTSTNVQEVLPGLLSPLTQSIVLRDFDAYTREALRRLGITPRTKEAIVGAFYGRAFLNLSLSQEIGGQTAAADKHYMGAEEEARRSSDGAALAKLRLALALPKTLYCLMRLGKAVARADALPPLSDPSAEDLAARIMEHGAVHVLASIYSGAMFTILGKLTEKWLDDKSGELHGRLLSGLAGMDSARPAFDLWELARAARGSGEVRAAVEHADPEALAALGSGDAIAFRARLEAFLRAHGHHSVQEMELRACTWDEDVATVLAMVRNYLDADGDRAPPAIEARARESRETASTDAVAKLRAWQRPLFRYFLRAAQRWVPLREHTKSMLIRAMHERRRFLRALTASLDERGLVSDASDAYYLTWDELTRLDEGKLDRAAASATIRRRRAEERRNRLVLLPETFTGAPVPTSPEPAIVPASRTLSGIGVSRGTVTGRARVILDPRSDSVIHPGEILVAPVTDAGWTPLFTVAAGLVVDIGGALSHGSTVAREYGLPAVVNVRTGTRLIRTGDVVTVDGTRGVVILGEDPAETSS